MDDRGEVLSRGKEYNIHDVRNNADRSRYNNWKNSIELRGYIFSQFSVVPQAKTCNSLTKFP